MNQFKLKKQLNFRWTVSHSETDVPFLRRCEHFLCVQKWQEREGNGELGKKEDRKVGCAFDRDPETWTFVAEWAGKLLLTVCISVEGSGRRQYLQNTSSWYSWASHEPILRSVVWTQWLSEAVPEHELQTFVLMQEQDLGIWPQTAGPGTVLPTSASRKNTQHQGSPQASGTQSTALPA